jgi:endonuclease/exonuclease/phosphatase family metal-dependent hydrolase
VRIVSLNAWGGAVFDDLAAWLPGCGADVLCLQEVTRTPGLGGWTRFSDADRDLPQRADLFDDVRSLLPDHEGAFVACDAGPVLDPQGRAHRQEFGLAVFVRRKLVRHTIDATFVHGTFTEHDRWPTSGRPRAAQAVRVSGGDGTRPVTVVHLHGLRDAAGKHDTPDRRSQAERLAAFATHVTEPGDLTVVGGDLNLLPDSETFDVLGAIGLIDLVGSADTRTARYRKPIRHASYLLVSDRSAVRAFAVPAVPEVSDHRPLVLDI